MPTLTQEAKIFLASHNAAARKKLGQNFMVDEETLSFIARSLKVKEGESVLEIGPGLGFLTRFLLKEKASVIAVEKDPIYAKFLAGYFKDEAFQVTEGNILEFDLTKVATTKSPIKVIGNIPYNITSPILEWLVRHRHIVSESVLTTQWEVASRLAANPGSKTWGSLSVFIQLYSEITLLKKISPGAFYPSPEVNSAVIHLNFFTKPKFHLESEGLFFMLVRRAFQKRRKTLLNSLDGSMNGSSGSPNLTKKLLSQAFQETGIASTRRPETLTLEEWANISNKIYFATS